MFYLCSRLTIYKMVAFSMPFSSHALPSLCNVSLTPLIAGILMHMRPSSIAFRHYIKFIVDESEIVFSSKM